MTSNVCVFGFNGYEDEQLPDISSLKFDPLPMQNFDAHTTFEKYGSLLENCPAEEILHVGCGCGFITGTVILPLYSKGLKKLVGIDRSDELLDYAKEHNSKNLMYYNNVELTNRREVRNFKDYWSGFTKIFILSCHDWISAPSIAMEQVKLLLRDNGECLISFVADSPVYDTYIALAQYTKWAKYMPDYSRYIPFTHTKENPEDPVRNLLTRVGLKVVKSETINREDPAVTLSALKDHICYVNFFLRRIPKRDSYGFLIDSMKELTEIVKKKLTYKLVIVLAKKSVPTTTNRG